MESLDSYDGTRIDLCGDYGEASVGLLQVSPRGIMRFSLDIYAVPTENIRKIASFVRRLRRGERGAAPGEHIDILFYFSTHTKPIEPSLIRVRITFDPFLTVLVCTSYGLSLCCVLPMALACVVFILWP